MIPQNIKVVALDDVEDHLIKIVRGLGRAGFSVSPFFFDDGELEDVPPRLLEGVRIVFSDIHMSNGSQDHKVNGATIANCLRKIIHPGPFVIIFWSQYPRESSKVFKEICERLEEVGHIAPIGFGSISKGEVLALSENPDLFDLSELKVKIFEEVKKFQPLLFTAAWEDKVFRASAKTTNKLFSLTSTYEVKHKLKEWGKLTAFLGAQAIGGVNAKKNIQSAVDQALLPLVEDNLSLMVGDCESFADSIVDHINDNGKVKIPRKISVSQLQTGYLIEEVDGDLNSMGSIRGVVIELASSFVNSGPFINSFGYERDELIKKEFLNYQETLNKEEAAQIKLHAVELGAECDHINNKVSTYRYLLAILVPIELMKLFNGEGRGAEDEKGELKFNNMSVMDAGCFSIKTNPHGEAGDFHLLISCRCFMALAKGKSAAGVPRFRLRRALLEEVAHRYVTHARRPGVMRFAA